MSMQSLKHAIDTYNKEAIGIINAESRVPQENLDDTMELGLFLPRGGYGGSMIKFTDQVQKFADSFDPAAYKSWLMERSEGTADERLVDSLANRVADYLNHSCDRMQEAIAEIGLSKEAAEDLEKEQNNDLDRLGLRIITAEDTLARWHGTIESTVELYSDEDDVSMPDLHALDITWRDGETPVQCADRILSELSTFDTEALNYELVDKYSVPISEARVFTDNLRLDIARVRTSIEWSKDRVFEAERQKELEKEAALRLEDPLNHRAYMNILDKFDDLANSITEYTMKTLIDHGFDLEFDKKGYPYFETSMELPGFKNGLVEQRQYIPFAGPSDSTNPINVYDLKRLPEGVVAMAEAFNPVMYANQILDSAHSTDPAAIAEAFDHGVKLKSELSKVSEILAGNLGIDRDGWNMDVDLDQSVKQRLIASQAFVVPRDIFDEVEAQGTDWEAYREYNNKAIEALSYALSFGEVNLMGEDEVQMIIEEDGHLINSDIDEALVRDLSNGIRELSNAENVLGEGTNLLKWDKVRDAIQTKLEDLDDIARLVGLEPDFMYDYETHHEVSSVAMDYDKGSLAVGFENPAVFDKAETGLEFLSKWNAVSDALSTIDLQAERAGVVNTGGIEGQKHVQEFMKRLSEMAFEVSIKYGPDRAYPYQDEVIAQRKAQAIAEPSVFAAYDKENPISIVEEVKKRHREAMAPKNNRTHGRTRAD